MTLHPGVLLAIGAGILVCLGLLFWPRRGLISLWKDLHLNTSRTRMEHVLKHLFNAENLHRKTTAKNLCIRVGMGLRKTQALLNRMESNGLIKQDDQGNISLTDEGNSYAIRIVRAHRLWERYLADETGLSGDEWHQKAERLEHTTSPEQVEALAAQLGNPLYDPHGTPIPTVDGVVGPSQGQPATSFAVGEVIVVTHVDKEQDHLYSQIQAEGIVPGMQLRILETSAQRIRFGSQDNEHVLAPVVAARIIAMPLPAEQIEVLSNETLSSLQQGETARVVRFAPTCRGIERRRLMDLGILPGTQVQVTLNGPFGDPKAFLVRQTAIALRKELSNLIFIERTEGAS